ncbi:DUF1501 domain-containing protein [Tamlana sp. 2201CG12-4]|uniref:DUF1501 domain-containing protein n=1 Tax=Tamlana sp. 2201CG12-4 TaxID=3112582 RepID=UPI002DB6A31F|nr:DUF1501 domain-containing protein [Tamlana sp. 2201CG12-4]MEC3907261.1 DUF1501 domain-containing protein [Tamlana sp. 2201CG12-4]
MDRRKFLLKGSLSLCAMGLSANAFSHLLKAPSFMKTKTAAEDRILILLRMGGGNDSLNTVIPLDQYANLTIQRPNLIIPESNLISLSGTNLALHPKMSGMANMFEDGDLSIIQGVAAPTGRSHFRATKVWHTGIIDVNHPQKDAGWLGRALDTQYPNFPENYPNSNYEDPFAIAIQNRPTPTCEGHEGNFSFPIVKPNNVTNIIGGTSQGVPLSYNADHLKFLGIVGAHSNGYLKRIQNATNSGNSISQNYGTDQLSTAFKNVARMISGGLKTKIYYINSGGFDTHGGQVSASDPTEGRHGPLLDKMSKAIKGFQEDMNAMGLNKRVIGMTYSEFGRQIAQNGSLGTDHGEASSMFMFGSCLSKQVVGNNPVISNTVKNGKALPKEIDYRDIYASVLRDWFGIDETDIEQSFEDYGGVTYYDIISPCATFSSSTPTGKDDEKIQLYPNPSTEKINVTINVIEPGNLKFTIVTISGQRVTTYDKHVHLTGNHEFTIPTSKLALGSYILIVQAPKQTERIKFIVR